MASFYRMDSESSHLPSMLSALEEQNLLFQLQLNNQPQDDSNEVGCYDILCDNRLHICIPQPFIFFAIILNFDIIFL